MNKEKVRGHRMQNRIEGMGGKNHSPAAAAFKILTPSSLWDCVISNSVICYPLD
jgi:hypothetical protein